MAPFGDLDLGLDLEPLSQGGGGGGAAYTLPLNTPLIVVGDSITNVSNSGQSSHRAFRHWLNVHANGHFYMGPASNQGIGAATILSAASANGYIGRRKDWWLNQISDGTRGTPRTAVMFAIGTNDLGKVGVTSAAMIAAMETHVQEVLDAGGVALLGAILKSTDNQTPGASLTQWTEYNAWVASKHDPANRIFALNSRTEALPNTGTTYLYDALHPTGLGAYLVGQADAADLAAHLGAGNILDAATALPGTTIAPGTGASGLIPTGLTVNCTTTGASGGATIGVTAVCTMTTDERGEPLLQVDIQGTASGAGRVIVGKTFSGVNAQYGDLFESFTDGRLRSAAGADPVGATTISDAFSTLGGLFTSTIDANAGDVLRGFSKALRSVPTVALANANNIVAELATVGIKAGTVDIRLFVGRNGYRQVETSAYAAPFNAGSEMPSGLQNPIGNRPRLNGTGTVGQTITLQPACMTGGGFDTGGGSMSFVVKRNGATILTKVPGDTPMTYVLQAADGGTTLTPDHTATNSISTTISTGAGLAVSA